MPKRQRLIAFFVNDVCRCWLVIILSWLRDLRKWMARNTFNAFAFLSFIGHRKKVENARTFRRRGLVESVRKRSRG